MIEILGKLALTASVFFVPTVMLAVMVGGDELPKAAQEFFGVVLGVSFAMLVCCGITWALWMIWS